MHAIEFLRAAGRAESRPIYAVHGDDVYLRGEAIDAVARVALGGPADELAVARFAGDSARLADVLDEVRTLPFLCKRRVAVVDDADPFVTAHRKELESYAERPSASGVLVLSVRAWPSSTRLAKLVEKAGVSVDCKAPAARDLAAWLVALARDRSAAKLDDDAAHLLIELVGPELGLLASEVEKLAVYAGSSKRVRKADVSAMVGAGQAEKIWATIEAATTGRAAGALDQIDRLLASGDPPIKILYALASSLRKVHHAGQLRMARVDHRDACNRAGLTYPAAIAAAQAQHAHLGPARVDRIPGLLLAADLDLKGSSTLAPRTIIERLLVEFARPRAD